MIHWLTIFIDNATTVMQLLANKDCTPLGHGGFGFRDAHQFCEGMKFYTTLGEPGGVLVCEGSYCERHQDDLRYWLGLGRCSRIDIAGDGFPFTPGEFRALYESGRVVTRLRKWRWEESKTGQTMYLGSRESERLLRVYNSRGFNRCELQIMGQRAHDLGHLFASSNAIELKGLIAAAFRIVEDDACRPDLCSPNKQYTDWLDGAKPLQLTKRDEPSSLNSFCAWFRRSVRDSLASARELLTDGEFNELLRGVPSEKRIAQWRRWQAGDFPVVFPGLPENQPREDLQPCLCL